MAVTITENNDKNVVYSNQPDVNRILFRNLTANISYEEIYEAISEWLEEHPEATTTVEDGSLLPSKLDSENEPYDGWVLSYNADAEKFEWYNIQADLTLIKQDINDLESTKANASSDNPNMGAGYASQLVSGKKTVDQKPYLFRKTTVDATLEYGDIVGCTVNHNQLCENLTSETTVRGITFTPNADGSISFSGTPSQKSVDIGSINVISGHRYLYRRQSVNGSWGLKYGAYFQLSTDYDDYRVVTGGDSFVGSQEYGLQFDSTATEYSGKIVPMIFDLTAEFGSAIADRIATMETATAGSGIAWIKSYGFFNKPYYPYSAPMLKSVSGLSAKVTRGFNQWDEEWEKGTYNVSTGAKASSNTNIRCKNFIPVIPSTVYRFTYGGSSTDIFRVVWYDADQNFVSSNITSALTNGTATSPDNAYYMTFYMNTGYGTTYKNDICINLSKPTGTPKNGDYVPYDGHTYTLDPDVTLRGILKLDANNEIYADGDVWKSEGTVTRNIDTYTFTGNENWTLSASGLFYWTTDSTTLPYRQTDGEVALNGYTSKPFSYNANHLFGLDMVISAYAPAGGALNTTRELYIKDSSCADTSALKTKLTGRTLLFKIVPTTESADPFQSPQICDPDGTEQFVFGENAFEMPVGHYTEYPDNLVGKLDGLPSNFSTLIAPTEVTMKATRNYTAGDLLIVDNVLLKATANIANGGTITVGTNVTATTLAEVISALS